MGSVYEIYFVPEPLHFTLLLLRGRLSAYQIEIHHGTLLLTQVQNSYHGSTNCIELRPYHTAYVCNHVLNVLLVYAECGIFTYLRARCYSGRAPVGGHDPLVVVLLPPAADSFA